MKKLAVFVLLLLNVALTFATSKCYAQNLEDGTNNASLIKNAHGPLETGEVNNLNFEEDSAAVNFPANAYSMPESYSFENILEDEILPKFNSDTLRLAKVLVRGMYSPDGSYLDNATLANNRASTLRKFIDSRLESDSEFDVGISSMSEVYDHLCELMKNANDPEYAEVRRIIDYCFSSNVQPTNGKSNEQTRFELLKDRLTNYNKGVLWKHLKDTYFPDLRFASAVFFFEKVQSGDKKSSSDFHNKREFEISNSVKSSETSQPRASLNLAKLSKSQAKRESSVRSKTQFREEKVKKNGDLQHCDDSKINVSSNGSLNHEVSNSKVSSDSILKTDSNNVRSKKNLKVQNMETNQLLYEKIEDVERTCTILEIVLVVSVILIILLLCLLTYYIYKHRKDKKLLTYYIYKHNKDKKLIEQLQTAAEKSQVDSNVAEVKEPVAEKQNDFSNAEQQTNSSNAEQAESKNTEELEEAIPEESPNSIPEENSSDSSEESEEIVREELPAISEEPTSAISEEQPSSNSVEESEESVPPVESSEETKEAEKDNANEDKADFVLYDKIMTLMQEQHPYRDPSFNVNTLASLLSSNRSYVSRSINHVSGKNFYAWIADYRNNIIIQELKQNPGLSLNTLCEITGHNSKEAFSRQFKQLNGMTFSEYKKRLQENSSGVLKIDFRD